jgi:hypothetical protein
MVRRLAVPLLLLVLGTAVAIFQALPGDAQEDPGPPEVTEVPLDSEPGAGDDPATPETDALPETTTAPPETTTPPETAPPELGVLEVGWQDEVAVDANMIAVEWQGDPGARFAIEVPDGNGGWRRAGDIEHHDNGPDPATPEGEVAAAEAARNVSEPLWTDDVSAVRVTLEAGAATAVTVLTIDSPPVGTPDLEVDVLESNVVAGGLLAAGGIGVVVAFVSGRRRLLALGVLIAIVAAGCVPPKAPAPPPGASMPGSIIPRWMWGGDLGWNTGGRECGQSSPTIASGIGRAVVHHTVNSNSYGWDQSAQVIRGIYAHHAWNLGWCDIGYNFLIDRFGTVYEGRIGGIDKAVVGAHAAGANTGTTGIAFIGDHRFVPVPTASQGSMINLIGWKFRVHRTPPVPGSVIGHFQVGQTECPGAHAIALLPMFQSAVAAQVPLNRSPIGHLDLVTRSGGNVRVYGWALDLDTSSSIPVAIYVNSSPVANLLANKTRNDIGNLYPGYGSAHGYDVTVPAPTGASICVAAHDATAGPATWLGCRVA